MKRPSAVFVIVALAATVCLLRRPAVAQPNDPSPSVQSLESLVSEWVRLRARIAEETRARQEKTLQLTEEIKLLETEKRELDAELADSDALVTSAEEKRAGLLESNRRMEKALADLETILDRTEAELRPWKALIPLPLRSELDPLFDRLGNARSSGTDAGAVRRLQIVIALYTSIENLQHAVHVTREMLPVDEGGRFRELDVVYVGLAGGFGVSPDNLAAAIGIPSGDRWVWQRRDDLAPEIRKAVAVFNREIGARFVNLPVTIPSEQSGEAP